MLCFLLQCETIPDLPQASKLRESRVSRVFTEEEGVLNASILSKCPIFLQQTFKWCMVQVRGHLRFDPIVTLDLMFAFASVGLMLTSKVGVKTKKKKKKNHHFFLPEMCFYFYWHDRENRNRIKNNCVHCKRQLPSAYLQIVFTEPLVAKTNGYLWLQLEISYYPIIVSRIVPISPLEQEAAAVKGN